MTTKAQTYPFSKEEIDGFSQTKQEFKDGKTTGRNWEDIQEDLDLRYKIDSVIKQVESLSQNR